jgi:hypothetical protein
MHGNELRKVGRIPAAVERTRRGVRLAPDPQARASAYAVLARAAGESGQSALFDAAIDGYRRHLDETGHDGMLTNRFTFREILLRGLTATGRAAQAVRLLDQRPDVPVAPQWVVIEQITVGEVLLASGGRGDGESVLLNALVGAEAHRLPHQAQRAVRLAAAHGISRTKEAGEAVLGRLDWEMRHEVEAGPRRVSGTVALESVR